jgi:hypothetical protein
MLAAAVVGAAMLGGSPLAAMADVPADRAVSGAATPSPTPTAEPGEAVFTVSPISSGYLQAASALNVSVTMTNDTAATTPGGVVSVSLGGAVLPDRAAVTRWLDGDAAAATVAEVAVAAFPAVAPGAKETQGVTVDATNPAVAALGPGVHPVQATLTTPTGTYTSSSVVVVPSPAARQVGVGIVVPITAPATAEGLLTAVELEELTAPEGSLTIQLDAVEGTEAILAVDPAVPAAIRVLGPSAPATALAWLSRLETLPNTRFALQYGDADVAAQIQAGIVPPLEPTSLQYAMAPADFTPTPSASPTSTPTPEPTGDPAAPIYPDLTSLLDVGGSAQPGVFWPETGTAGQDVVTALGALAVDDQRGITLVPSTSTVAGAGGATVPARGDVDGSRVLIYDAAVSEQLAEASTLDDATLRNAHLAAASALLSFALAETDGAPLLVTVDRGEDRSRVGLRTAVATALQNPAAIPTQLDALLQTTPVGVEAVETEPDQSRVAAASALVAEEQKLTEFSSVLDDPTLISGPERNEILQLLGQGWRADPDGWGVALAAHREETAETIGSVGILRASPIQLITSGAVIPVWVRNDLPYPVNVTLLASPDDLRLRVQETTSVVAQPESNTRVDVPVQAQVGSGDVTISFELRSPTGVRIGTPQTREVHVRADWEGIGLVIVAVLAVGFVALGVVRTVLRRRGRKERVDAEAGATDEPRAPGDSV